MRRTIVKAWIGGLGVSALVGSMWIAGGRVMGQAPIVQPKSAGYGAGKGNAGQAGAGQAGAGQVGQGGNVVDPQKNPQLNPQFNPQLNAQGGNRVQNQLQQALRDGMTELRFDGLQKAWAGLTTLGEVHRRGGKLRGFRLRHRLVGGDGIGLLRVDRHHHVDWGLRARVRLEGLIGGEPDAGNRRQARYDDVEVGELHRTRL